MSEPYYAEDVKHHANYLESIHPCPASLGLNGWLNDQLQQLSQLALSQETIIGLIEMDYLSLLLDLELKRPTRRPHPD